MFTPVFIVKVLQGTPAPVRGIFTQVYIVQVPQDTPAPVHGIFTPVYNIKELQDTRAPVHEIFTPVYIVRYFRILQLQSTVYLVQYIYTGTSGYFSSSPRYIYSSKSIICKSINP